MGNWGKIDQMVGEFYSRKFFYESLSVDFDFTLFFTILHRCYGCPEGVRLFNDAFRRRLGGVQLINDGHLHHGEMYERCDNCTFSNHCEVNAEGEKECFVTVSGLDLDLLFASASYSDDSVDEPMAEEEEEGEPWDANNVFWWMAVVVEPLICLFLVCALGYMCFVVKQTKKMMASVQRINEGMAEEEMGNTANTAELIE